MLRIEIESLVTGIDGMTVLMTVETASVENLITGFIFERRLRPEIAPDFCLTDARGNILKRHRTVASYDMKDGDKVYLIKNKRQLLFGCRNWTILATLSSLIAIVGLSVITYLYTKSAAFPFDYVVVIDAGSTHSDLYVFQWRGEKFRNTGVVEEIATSRCEGEGLANYNDISSAADSLQGCIQLASTTIPPHALGATEIYLGATAGMRLLMLSNATAATLLMQEVRAVICGKSRFKCSLDNIRIISGEEEAAYGWISVNFLGKTLAYAGSSPFSYGALDLGGASTQTAYSTSTNATVSLQLFSERYDLYSQSYLCYGLRETERMVGASLIMEQNSTVVNNPCRPFGNATSMPYDSIFGHVCTKGFSTAFPNSTIFTMKGTSNSAECKIHVRHIFHAANPTHVPDKLTIRSPEDRREFMAFSGYYSTMEFLNLSRSTGDRVSLSAFRNHTDAFCARSWKEISMLDPSDPHSPYLTMYCFNAHFVDVLLTDAYGFTDQTFENIIFIEKVGGTSIGWPLGMALNATNARASEMPPEPAISPVTFGILLTVFLLLLLSAILCALKAIRVARHHRNYQPLSTYGAI
ncbi:hypothetical protein RvY_10598 [Ramazzottius varieornatus]|uniref:Uncharacterized protein n=1 Tax=Ramazzottius varieornatus TaxID=947166 RepID=A0A1D1VFD7_RAMVA|nr:hypothetical protein RvY_10598 [Ramazzottius varieornatus]